MKLTIPQNEEILYEVQEYWYDGRNKQSYFKPGTILTCRADAISQAKLLCGYTANRVRILRKEVIAEVTPDELQNK